MNNILNIANLEQFENESISVTQLNKLAKTLLENNMPIFWIKGEISGLKIYNHAYFDLKDETSKISCIIFATLIKSLNFKLANGVKVEVRGTVTVYPPNGSYQINIERIRQIGLGELWEAYQRLLNKLKNEGLFEATHKKKLPFFPEKIGVITSKEGAVIRDVITTLKRRMPNIQIIIYHSAVQGSDAGMQVTKAIKTANDRNEVDVLIICRGGGGMQDLWTFNEEVVIREAFLSHIPIISAIGHETDITLLDFVADVRAPTPTAAAELVARSSSEWLSLLSKLENNLMNNFEQYLNYKKQQIDLFLPKIKLFNPYNQLRERTNKMLNYKDKLSMIFKYKLSNKTKKLNSMISPLKTALPINTIKSQSNIISNLENKLKSLIHQKIIYSKQSLDNFNKQIIILNPANVLARGYAIVKNQNDDVVITSEHLKHNDKISIYLHSDKINAIVNKNNGDQLDI